VVLIGMLHHRKHPDKVKKAYAYAAVAKAEGAELLYFSPKNVNFEDRRINGYMYKDGKWDNVYSRFPDVIYNTGSPMKLNVSKEIIERLKGEIPFTTNSIGHKMRVYNRLLKEGTYVNYLIPSKIIHSTTRFIQFLKQYRKVVFKPVYGHKGQGIILIEPQREKYHIIENV